MVAVRLAFCNTFLNLSARVCFLEGVTTGMGNGSLFVFVVIHGSGKWFGWAGSGTGIDIGGFNSSGWS